MTTTGVILGLVLTAIYAAMFFKPEASKAWAKKAHRNNTAGTYAMAIGMGWFWLLVAPEGSILGKWSMPLGEFSALKPYMQLGVPLMAAGMIIYVKEFLFVRGLGLVMLMAAAPILYSSFLKDAPLRILMPITAYIMIIKALFFVGMPYLFRDGVDWLTASESRWKNSALAGMIYGGVILICALTVWRGF